MTTKRWLLGPIWAGRRAACFDQGYGSSAAFTVVAGALRELRPDGRALARHRRQPGETVRVAPGVVHDVGNPWPEPAVSIHAYSPPLTAMTYYRRTRDGLVATETRATDGPER